MEQMKTKLSTEQMKGDEGGDGADGDGAVYLEGDGPPSREKPGRERHLDLHSTDAQVRHGWRPWRYRPSLLRRSKLAPSPSPFFASFVSSFVSSFCSVDCFVFICSICSASASASVCPSFHGFLAAGGQAGQQVG